MKVKELRDILKNYNEKEKENIIVNLYNVIPKKVKDSKDVDRYLMSANEKKEKIKPNSEFNEDLMKEMDEFIYYASEGFYSGSNKYVSKEDRRNWRFKVMRYYKALCTVDLGTKDGEVATIYLSKLYELLSVGCLHLTFSNWDTFHAIQVKQTYFLKRVLERILFNGLDNENLGKAIDLCFLPTDNETWRYEPLLILFSFMDAKEDKLHLIDLTERKIDNYCVDNRVKYDDYNVSKFGEAVAFTYLELHMIDEAVTYYLKFKSDKEVALFVILERLKKLNCFEDWLYVYEKYKDKVEYRNRINEDYKIIKEMI